MRLNWAYQIPYRFFDETATGTGNVAPAAVPATPPAPSSTPEPAPATPPPGGGGSPSSAEPASAPGSDPFAGLDGDIDDMDAIVLDEGAPTDGAPSPQPGAVPAPAPAPAAAKPGDTPASPPAAPAPAPAVPAPSATSPASPGEQFVEAIKGLKANGKDLGEWAGQNLFKLSDEDAAALATNAEEVIPRLMGRTYQEALTAAATLVQNFLPQIIQHEVGQFTARSERARSALAEFYSSNPDLKESEHGATVTTWAKHFRATNPKASRADAIKFVANAVRLQHGLPPPSAAPAVRSAPPAFTPARPGGRQPVPPPQGDPFSGLDQDFDDGP